MSRKLTRTSMVALLCMWVPVWVALAEPSVDPSAFRELTGQLEDVQSSSGPLGSLLVESLTPEEIAQKLKTEFDITLATEIAQFDPALLYYLYSYFKVFPPDPDTPITLEQTTIRGPELVRKEQSSETPGIPHARDTVRLIFTQDAAAQAVTEQVRQTLAALQAHPEQATPNQEVRISFQNALFEKLTALLLTYDDLVEIFQQVYHLEVNAAPTGEIGEFSAEELSALLRPLVDLRPAVLRTLKLTKLTRMAHGIKFVVKDNPNKNIIALYLHKSQEIQLTDEAFERRCDTADPENPDSEPIPPRLQPEDLCTIDESFVHELGHTLWFGLPPETQNLFRQISWQNSGERWLPKADHTQFVSPQSMQNPEEDFSEHFRAYLNHATRMDAISSDKATFFKTLLFPNTTYLRTVHERMRVQVDSDQPDVAPPTLTDTLRNSVTVALTGSDPQTLEVTIRNLSDDISGIQNIHLQLGSSDNRQVIHLNLYPKDFDPEKKNYHRIFQIQNNTLSISEAHTQQKIYAGTYRLTYVSFTDRAQNQARYTTTATDFPPFAIQGLTRCARKTKCLDENEKRALEAGIHIERLETNTPFETFRMRIPLSHTSELKQLSLHWLSERGQAIPDIPITLFRSTPGSDTLEFDFQLSDRLEADTLHLVSFQLSLAENEIFLSEHPAYTLDYRSNPNLTITITPPNTDQTAFGVNINAVPKPSVQHTEQPNPNGGNRTIKILIPVDELELEARDQISVSIRATMPSGKAVTGQRIFSPSALKTAIVTQEGQSYLVIPIELPPNNEEGTYSIETLQITKTLQSGTPPQGVNRQSAHWKTLRFNLQEREIQTKFRIHILDN